MLDEKHSNQNGCCILTHITQREAVACLDHEKYCQIGIFHPKFDIIVLLILFCVYGDQAMEPYLHSGWTLPSRLVPWQRGHKMPSSLCGHLESFLLSFHVYSLLWPVKGAGNVKLISNSEKRLPPKIRSVTQCVQVHVWWWLMLQANGRGVAFARDKVLLPHSCPLLTLREVLLNCVMVSWGKTHCHLRIV